MAQPPARRPLRVGRRGASSSPLTRGAARATRSTASCAGAAGSRSSAVRRPRSRSACGCFPSPGYPFTLALRIDYAARRRRAAGHDARREPRRARLPLRRRLPSLPDARRGGLIDARPAADPGGAVLITDERAIPTALGAGRGHGATTSASRARSARSRSTTASPSCARDGDGRARVTLADDARGVALWLDEAYGHVMVYSGDTLSPPSAGGAGSPSSRCRARRTRSPAATDSSDSSRASATSRNGGSRPSGGRTRGHRSARGRAIMCSAICGDSRLPMLCIAASVRAAC